MLGYDSYITAMLEILFDERMGIYLFEKVQLEWPLVVDAIAESDRGNHDKFNKLVKGWFAGGYKYAEEESILKEPDNFPSEYKPENVGPNKEFKDGAAVLAQINATKGIHESYFKFWETEYNQWRKNWGPQSHASVYDKDSGTWALKPLESPIFPGENFELEGPLSPAPIHAPGQHGWNYAYKYGPEDQSQVVSWVYHLHGLFMWMKKGDDDTTAARGYYLKNYVPWYPQGDTDFEGHDLYSAEEAGSLPAVALDAKIMVTTKGNLKGCNRVLLAQVPSNAAHRDGGWWEDAGPAAHMNKSAYTAVSDFYKDSPVARNSIVQSTTHWTKKCVDSLVHRKAMALKTQKEIAKLHDFYIYAAHLHAIKVEIGGFMDNIDVKRQKLYYLAACILAAGEPANKDSLKNAKDESELVQAGRQKLNDMFEKKLLIIGRTMAESFVDAGWYKEISAIPAWDAKDGNLKGYQGKIDQFIKNASNKEKEGFLVTSNLNVVGDQDSGLSAKRYGNTIDSIIFDLVDSI